MGQPLADCDFNLAALHPAYPIKRRTSAERTQASPERRHPEESPALDPLENNINPCRFIESFAPAAAAEGAACGLTPNAGIPRFTNTASSSTPLAAS
jgi:hypothetical protein